MKINFILCGILFAFVAITESAKTQINPKCNQKSIQKIDKQMSPLLPLLSGGKFPENEEQMQKYCTTASQSMEIGTAYVKICGGTFGPFIEKVVKTIFKKEFNNICKLRNATLVDKLMSAAKCGNSVSNKLNKCLNNILDTMSALKSVPFEDVVNSGCCHAYKITSCIQQSVVKSKRCDKNLVEKIEKKILPEIGNFCGLYFSDNQKCKKLVSNTPKLSPSYVRPKSFFEPLMGIMDKFRAMKCNPQTSNKLDTVVQQMLTIGTPEKIPENSKQLEKWCTTAIQNVPYFYGYIESCLSDFGKWLVKIMAGAVTTNFETYSGFKNKQILDNPTPQMQNYINAAKCGNKAEPKLNLCFDQFNENILGIIQAPERSRIKMACCNAYNFRTCIFNATSSTKGCNPETIEWAERQVMSGVEGAINLVCNDLWGNQRKCDPLMAEIPKLNPKTYVKPKSPFFPMIKLFDSFPDVEK